MLVIGLNRPRFLCGIDLSENMKSLPRVATSDAGRWAADPLFSCFQETDQHGALPCLRRATGAGIYNFPVASAVYA